MERSKNIEGAVLRAKKDLDAFSHVKRLNLCTCTEKCELFLP